MYIYIHSPRKCFPPAADSVRRVLRPGRWYESMNWMGKLWQNPIFGLGNFMDFKGFFFDPPIEPQSVRWCLLGLIPFVHHVCDLIHHVDMFWWLISMPGDLCLETVGRFLAPQPKNISSEQQNGSCLESLYYIYTVYCIFIYNIYIYSI